MRHRVTSRLWLVMLAAAFLAVASTVGGMCLSVSQDLPTNQTIAVTTCASFIVVLACRLAQWSVAKVLLRRQRPEL
jgi:ABC-type Mn2+/Zn2+ transport system permease subunit